MFRLLHARLDRGEVRKLLPIFFSETIGPVPQMFEHPSVSRLLRRVETRVASREIDPLQGEFPWPFFGEVQRSLSAKIEAETPAEEWTPSPRLPAGCIECAKQMCRA